MAGFSHTASKQKQDKLTSNSHRVEPELLSDQLCVFMFEREEKASINLPLPDTATH